MTQSVLHRHRFLGTVLVSAALLLSLGGATAYAADHDRGRDRRWSESHRDHRHDRKHYDRYRDDRRHRGHHDRRSYYQSDRHRAPHRFAVPKHLHRRDYRHYDRYYRGTAYYAPHRHSHRIYYFPVIVGGYTEYRPYAYCGEAYYPDHHHHGGVRGHLGLHFTF